MNRWKLDQGRKVSLEKGKTANTGAHTYSLRYGVFDSVFAFSYIPSLNWWNFPSSYNPSWTSVGNSKRAMVLCDCEQPPNRWWHVLSFAFLVLTNLLRPQHLALLRCSSFTSEFHFEFHFKWNYCNSSVWHLLSPVFAPMAAILARNYRLFYKVLLCKTNFPLPDNLLELIFTMQP